VPSSGAWSLKWATTGPLGTLYHASYRCNSADFPKEKPRVDPVATARCTRALLWRGGGAVDVEPGGGGGVRFRLPLGQRRFGVWEFRRFSISTPATRHVTGRAAHRPKRPASAVLSISLPCLPYHCSCPHTVQSDTTRCGVSRVGHVAKRPRLYRSDPTRSDPTLLL
jgi:hypothetical protein